MQANEKLLNVGSAGCVTRRTHQSKLTEDELEAEMRHDIDFQSVRG